MTAPRNKPLSQDDFERFTRYYHTRVKSSEWGNLGIVLSDRNVKDKHVEQCIQIAQKADDSLGVYLGNVLLGMSKSQRHKLANTIGHPF